MTNGISGVVGYFLKNRVARQEYQRTYWNFLRLVPEDPSENRCRQAKGASDYTLFVLLILSYEVRKSDRSNVVLGQVVENI